MDPLTAINPRKGTPQTEKAKPTQVANSAGGYSFQVDEMQQALRFLILGTTGGSYYASERQLTKDNADVILDLANRRGRELVDLIVDVSVNGRAPKQDQTMFALAACTASTDVETRRAAYAAVDQVCRIGTHLFQFVGYMEQFHGWNKSSRRAVGNWYTTKPVNAVAYQAIKYRQRNGWSHRDLLRLSHPSGADLPHSQLFDWITKPDADVERILPANVNGFLAAQAATKPKEWCALIDDFRLPFEALPTEALKHAEVWDALLPHMGITALIRNLGRMTSLGVIGQFGAGKVTGKLTDKEAIRKGRVHPITVLNALMTYRSSRGLRGSLTWSPVPQVIDALDEAFYLAFGELIPAGKSTLVALDVSGSMGFSQIPGMSLTPRDASAAMAMTIVRTEPNYGVVGFCHDLTVLNISAKQRLDDVVRTVNNLPFGMTDCSLPMVWAKKNKLDIDTFVVLTDSETYAGSIHPHQALEQYRQTVGHDAREVVVGMVSNNFTIADPSDPGQLDVVGFDTATPDIIRGFSAGEF